MKIDNKRNILEKNLEKQIRKYKNLMKTYKNNGKNIVLIGILLLQFQDIFLK